MIKEKHFPQVAVGAVIFKDNQVLLVKRSNPPAQGSWAVPGGKINPGETMQQALVREVKEETGLDISVGEIVHVFDVIRHNNQGELTFHYVIIDFLCEYKKGELIAGDDAQEARWISQLELKEMNINPKTKRLLKDKFNF